MKNRQVSRYILTLEQKTTALGCVYYEIQQLASSSRLHSDNKLVDNAFVESTLVHVRVLLDFFEHSTRSVFRKDGCSVENDDVIAVDYGFPAKRLNIGEEYRTRLNKDLVHLSYSRTVRRTPDVRPWPFADVVVPIAERSIKFIDWLEERNFEGMEEDVVAHWRMLRTDLVLLCAGPPCGGGEPGTLETPCSFRSGAGADAHGRSPTLQK